MHAAGPSARAQDLSAWCIAPQQRLGSEWREPFVAGLAERLAEASPADCVYAGFEFDRAPERLRGSWLDHGCLATLEFNRPEGEPEHRAISIGWTLDETSQVWVDRKPLPVPLIEGKRPAANPYAAGWCGAHWYFVELADQWDHPAQETGAPRMLSTVRGLLIWDADAARARIERPRHDERWTSPRLVSKDGALHLLPTWDAPVSGAARVIPAPW